MILTTNMISVGWDFVPPNVPTGVYPNTTGAELAERADVYDNALAVIFLLNEGLIDQARKISDTLVLLIDNEILSDGRLRAAYSVSNPIDRVNYASHWASFASSAVDSTIDTGDLAFVTIALTRMYIHTGLYKYLKAAIKVATFIQSQQISTSWGGYQGGYTSSDNTDQKVDWRAINHNLAIYAAADNLYGITSDQQWLTMKSIAERFISSMFDSTIGSYRYGAISATTDIWNTKTVSANAQAFKILSGADSNDDRDNQALQWVLNNLVTFDSAVDDITGQTINYQGVVYSQSGSGIDSESTAALAMALTFQAEKIQPWNPTLAKTFRDTANKMLASLLQMQKYAPNSDGLGIVASPNQDGALVWKGNEFDGETYRYFPLLHSASTAWTGIAVEFMKNGDQYASPFSSYYKKSNKDFFGSSVFASGESIHPVALDSSRPLNIVALIAAGFFLGLLVLGTVILCVTNARLYTRNKQLESRPASTPIKFTRLATSTPLSPAYTPASPGVMQGGSFAVYASPNSPSQDQSFLHQ
jgi:hypothetical protein